MRKCGEKVVTLRRVYARGHYRRDSGLLGLDFGDHVECEELFHRLVPRAGRELRRGESHSIAQGAKG